MNPVPDMHRDVGISLKNRRNFMNPYLTVIGGACLFLLAAAWLITAENHLERSGDGHDLFEDKPDHVCAG